MLSFDCGNLFVKLIIDWQNFRSALEPSDRSDHRNIACDSFIDNILNDEPHFFSNVVIRADELVDLIQLTASLGQI